MYRKGGNIDDEKRKNDKNGKISFYRILYRLIFHFIFVWLQNGQPVSCKSIFKTAF